MAIPWRRHQIRFLVLLTCFYIFSKHCFSQVFVGKSDLANLSYQRSFNGDIPMKWPWEIFLLVWISSNGKISPSLWFTNRRNCPHLQWGRLSCSNLGIRVGMKYFKEDKNIYNAFQYFWILKINFVQYKISAAISLTEAKTHIINIHICWVSHGILITKKIFHISFIFNNLHLLH